MIDFLLEIGFEEFPPRLLRPAAEDLTERIQALLKEKKVFFRSIRTIYTPRRMGTIVLGLSRRQKSQVIEIQGPPKRFAYDEKGKPTEKMIGFMKTNNLKASEIICKRTKKGDYVCGKTEMAGATTESILRSNIPLIIGGLEFEKTMVWNEERVRFPRPIRWIIALLDRKPLRFDYAGVQANRYSWPNQHFSFKPIRLEKPREYMNFLRHGGVIVDPNERKKIIMTRIRQAADKCKGKPVYTDDMIEEINCTTEYPEVVTGTFDEHYMTLPREVLMTVLRAHGNVIWIRDKNEYIYVFSAKKKALQNVKTGYERVIESRLNDAYFYYQNDVKNGLENMLMQTKNMTWLEGLGSLYQKSMRLQNFADVYRAVPGVDMKALKRAALLCKADLLSEMVREKEFTSLQGIMGGYYSLASGEDEPVASAIGEHYLPRYVGDGLPRSLNGALLSIADKLDSIVGAYLSGNRPSGSYDPFAVRRNGYGVINLLDIFGIELSLFEAGTKMLELHAKRLDEGVMREFFDERMTRYLQDNGYRYDEIKAVLATWNGNVPDTKKRCDALKSFRGSREFVKLVIGQKRVRNILKNLRTKRVVDGALVREPAEKALVQVREKVKPNLEAMIETKNYAEVLKMLLEMRPAIDKFFDDVLVMCDDEKLRANRLAIVSSINGLFSQFADFSQIVIEGEETQR
ncbi:MAG: glycine--tRNA ligase subunit beta [candidate division WOR-3 bacterium]|nr:MAG: glycine--tRNA ligase subunit beta [candidate division WOR-3 bacterium]